MEGKEIGRKWYIYLVWLRGKVEKEELNNAKKLVGPAWIVQKSFPPATKWKTGGKRWAFFLFHSYPPQHRSRSLFHHLIVPLVCSGMQLKHRKGVVVLAHEGDADDSRRRVWLLLVDKRRRWQRKNRWDDERGRAYGAQHHWKCCVIPLLFYFFFQINTFK